MKNYSSDHVPLQKFQNVSCKMLAVIPVLSLKWTVESQRKEIEDMPYPQGGEKSNWTVTCKLVDE